MCEKFSCKPSDYLFNDLICAHTRLVVDMTFFLMYDDYMEKEEKKRKRKASMRGDSF